MKRRLLVWIALLLQTQVFAQEIQTPELGFGLDGAQVGDETCQSLRPQADIRTLGADVDSLHEQLDDARLLAREQFVPERV